MPSVKLKYKGKNVDKDKTFESGLRRFRKAVESSGVLLEVSAREYYEKPTARRKRKKQEAIKRTRAQVRKESLTTKRRY